MLALKYLLMSGGLGMILAAIGTLGYDWYGQTLYRRALATPGAALPPEPKARWRTSLALAFLAWGPILLAFIARTSIRDGAREYMREPCCGSAALRRAQRPRRAMPKFGARNRGTHYNGPRWGFPR